MNESVLTTIAVGLIVLIVGTWIKQSFASVPNALKAITEAMKDLTGSVNKLTTDNSVQDEQIKTINHTLGNYAQSHKTLDENINKIEIDVSGIKFKVETLQNDRNYKSKTKTILPV